MAEGLNAYLRAARDRPFVWGTFDCCTFAADWVISQTCIDPMDDLRGGYDCEETAQKLIRKGGGLTALIEARMCRSDDPIIGVLTAPGQEPAASIKVGGRWAILTPEGLGIVNAQAIGAQVIGFR